MKGKSQTGNIVALTLTHASASKFLKEISADSGRVFFTDHADKGMQKRKITRKQVLCCLRHGRIVEGPARSANGNWEFAVEQVSAGDVIRVPAAFEHDERGNMVIVISAYYVN